MRCSKWKGAGAAAVAMLTLACGSSKSTGTETTMSQNKACIAPACLAPSAAAPGGIPAEKAPMFVTLGFDDNGVVGKAEPGASEAMSWALEMFAKRKNSDGSRTTGSFYITTSYGVGDENGYGGEPGTESPALVKRTWRALLDAGHEIGNHTHAHLHGRELVTAAWEAQMRKCLAVLTAPYDPNESLSSPDRNKGIGIDAKEVIGFRTPFLEYNNSTFIAASTMRFAYDCSLEEGYQPDQDGTNFLWPYTLDSGSPGHDLQVSWGSQQPLTPHPGLYELPVYVVIAPPDELCESYGVEKGLRDRLKKRQDYLDVADGKITGFDYNLWALFQMTGPEFLAVLKYTFDLRMKGNRAPFLFGTHSDMYAAEYAEPLAATPAERRKAIEDFLDYALSHSEARVVAARDVLNWIKAPTPLN